MALAVAESPSAVAPVADATEPGPTAVAPTPDACVARASPAGFRALLVPPIATLLPLLEIAPSPMAMDAPPLALAPVPMAMALAATVVNRKEIPATRTMATMV